MRRLDGRSKLGYCVYIGDAHKIVTKKYFVNMYRFSQVRFDYTHIEWWIAILNGGNGRLLSDFRVYNLREEMWL